MKVQGEEALNATMHDSLDKSGKVNKGYHSVPFDAQVVNYYVLEERVNSFQDRMLDRFKHLDERNINIKNDLNAKVEDMKNHLNTRISGVETRLNDKMDGVEVRFNDKMDGVETRLNGKIDGVNGEMVRVGSIVSSIYYRLGFKGQLVGSLTVIGAIGAVYFVSQGLVVVVRQLVGQVG
ncbi:BdrQ protein [Candidatus Borreliella tachyglossi]|uniref:BdrQ protein n=1 Tax=Candidatus Borreliella tachyglossi TaxID=1964448 RepID=UPI004041228F